MKSFAFTPPKYDEEYFDAMEKLERQFHVKRMESYDSVEYPPFEKAEPYNSGDLDAINELKESPGFSLLAERIRDHIEKLRDHLEAGDPTQAAEIRGECKALRMVLTIPNILKGEIIHVLKDKKS